MADQTLQVRIEGDLKNLQAALTQAKTQVGQFENTVETNSKKVNKSFGQMESFAKGALSGIVAGLSVQALVQFGKAVLETTAKFQKFEAVLTNTLGSNSAAQAALAQIQQFAAKTPFAVDELTASFVKLANQGFKPTLDQMRSLGDLASSTGKSFDQLAEAILDAQVGEFERLKEFGVRASKEGDNVTFTFKGVETQVKATDSAIRGYILSLGDASGVSGSMAKISETLGGKMSNLGDNIETLKLAIGDQTSGIFAASLDWLNSFVEATSRAAKGVAKIREEANFAQLSSDLEANRKAVQDLASDYQSLDPALTTTQALAKAIAALKQPLLDATEGGDAFFNQGLTLSELRERIKGFEDLAVELFSVKDVTTLTLEEFKKIATEANKAVFLKMAMEADSFNSALKETLRIQNSIASGSGNVRTSFTPQDIAIPGMSGMPTKDEPILTADIIASNDFYTGLARAQSAFESFGGDFQGAVENFALNLNDLVRNNIGSAFQDFGYSIGEALANGTSVIDALGKSLLESMARFMGDFGAQLISVGVAGLAFSTMLETIKKGGPAAIPASIAAIAAGTALTIASGALRGIAGGGLGGGGGSVGSASPGATAMAYQGTGVNSGYDAMSDVEFRIRGNDLVGVINQQEKKNKRG